MSLNLMYITNDPEIAKVAEKNGVQRIFVDMEYIGKSKRQGGMDTVQNHHTIKDVARVKRALTTSKLMCRVNPIHEKSDEYMSSEDEINGAIDAGADILMLPFFRTAAEVSRFIECVNGRARTMLLFETPEAIENIDEILSIGGVDEVFIGLNDLSLGYHKKFMFELLADGTVESIIEKFKKYSLPYGFGGIAALGKGDLPSEFVIKEHYRLGSTCAILSRTFCDANKATSLNEIEETFNLELNRIRILEEECDAYVAFFEDNMKELRNRVTKIVEARV